MQFLEDMPDGLHERNVHSLVVILEVDPSSEPLDYGFPLFGVPHDDASALMIILFDAHIIYLLFVGDL